MYIGPGVASGRSSADRTLKNLAGAIFVTDDVRPDQVVDTVRAVELFATAGADAGECAVTTGGRRSG